MGNVTNDRKILSSNYLKLNDDIFKVFKAFFVARFIFFKIRKRK